MQKLNPNPRKFMRTSLSDQRYDVISHKYLLSLFCMNNVLVRCNYCDDSDVGSHFCFASLVNLTFELVHYRCRHRSGCRSLTIDFTSTRLSRRRHTFYRPHRRLRRCTRNVAARSRNAGRSTEWRTVNSGVRNASGRRRVLAFSTEDALRDTC